MIPYFYGHFSKIANMTHLCGRQKQEEPNNMFKSDRNAELSCFDVRILCPTSLNISHIFKKKVRIPSFFSSQITAVVAET